jgi:hypothetical protein
MERLEEFELQARMLKEAGKSYAEAAALLLKGKARSAKADKPKGKPSHWQKLTQGLCDVGFEEQCKREQSAADFKKAECNRKKQRAAEAKFKRAQHSPAESRKVSDNWQNKGGTLRGFHNPKAKPGPVTMTKGGAA